MFCFLDNMRFSERFLSGQFLCFFFPMVFKCGASKLIQALSLNPSVESIESNNWIKNT